MMRPASTITVDLSRGGDYALADYRRQARRVLPGWGMMMRQCAAVMRMLYSALVLPPGFEFKPVGPQPRYTAWEEN